MIRLKFEHGSVLSGLQGSCIILSLKKTENDDEVSRAYRGIFRSGR